MPECAMNFWRQMDIIKEETLNRTPVHLIGCGGIGSTTAIALTKMGLWNLNIWDNDLLEDHNFPNQFHAYTELGQPKVNAMINLIENLTSYNNIIPHNEKVTPIIAKKFKGYVISGVDNIPSRLDIWNSIKYNIGVPKFIDGRMSSETMEIFVINPSLPSDIEFYEERTPEDNGNNYEQESCTNRAIIYNTMVIGGLIATFLKKLVSRQPCAKYTLFDLASMTLIEE